MKVTLTPQNNTKVAIKQNGVKLGEVKAIDILNPVQYRFFKNGLREFDLNFKYIVGKA